MSSSVGLSQSQLDKIQVNDTLRVHSYLAMCLALKKTGSTWSESRIMNLDGGFWGSTDGSQSSANLTKVFLFSNDWQQLSEKQDCRVEDMVANQPAFFNEQLDLLR